MTVDVKDPPWMNDEIKNKINYKNSFYQLLKKYKINLMDLDLVDELNLHQSYLQLILKERINTIVILLKN